MQRTQPTRTGGSDAFDPADQISCRKSCSLRRHHPESSVDSLEHAFLDLQERLEQHSMDSLEHAFLDLQERLEQHSSVLPKPIPAPRVGFEQGCTQHRIVSNEMQQPAAGKPTLLVSSVKASSTFVLSFADVSKHGVVPSPKYVHHS
jgi:hypothetical protein